MTATNSINPADLVMSAMVAFLTPMLLAATAGNQAQARATAIQAVNAYAAQNPAELLLIAQSVALGLAVLSSISLSMAENIPINLILRLRANAASLHRASEQCRRALTHPEPEHTAPDAAPLSAIEIRHEQQNIAEIARTHQRIADYQASRAKPPAAPTAPASPILPPPECPDSPATMKAAMAAIVADSERRIAEAGIALNTAGQPIPPANPLSAPNSEDEWFRSAWSSAMADIADEMTTGIANLPPVERKAANIRIAALNASATQLVSPPPTTPR
jgi:hypothetical protein